MFEILQGENPDTSPPDEHKEVRESGFDYLDDNNYSMKSDQVKSGKRQLSIHISQVRVTSTVCTLQGLAALVA